jgi:acyl dehydratase
MAEHPIGKRYDGGTFTVEAGAGRAYAEATDDPHPAYRGDDAICPPMFHVRGFIVLMMQCATDPELGIDMLRLVHGEHGMTFHRALRTGDVVALEGELRAVVEKSSGTLYTFALRGRIDGELALEGETTYFIRGKRKPGEKKAARPAPEAPPTPDWTVEQPVAADQATRYAAASGDHNPIHLDANVAAAAGLPGVILHGLCTMAFAARDLTHRYAEEDPSKLQSIAVRFAAPVFPGETLTLQVWEDDGAVTFQTVNGKGKPVLTGGRAAFV